VPGAAPPGAKKAGPVAPTQPLARYSGPVTGPGDGYAPVAPRRSGARRFFVALLALLLIVAVPVVSAYVSYKLASGENPFAWPPSMDLSHVF